MPAKKYRGKWCADVIVEIPGQGRKRLRRKSPIQTRRGAEQYANLLAESALSTSTPFDSERRFSEHAVDFLENYAVANNKFSEVSTKEVILRVHLVPALGDRRLSEIGPAQIEQYKAQKLKDGLARKSVNNHLTVLRKALVVAQEWGLLAEVPVVKRLKVAKPEFDFLSFDEADRLLDAAEAEWLPMIGTALQTGLRLGELLALRWEDVDLVAGRILVRQAVAFGELGTPKSGRGREVPLSDTALRTLKAHRHLMGPLVFCAPDGSMMPRDKPRHPLHRACRRAGLRLIGWHALRHTFASHLVMRGAPIRAVQELLGHASIEMTMRYAHLSPEVARETVRLLDDRWNNSGTSRKAEP